MHKIFQALVQPYFNYCNVVWANCGPTLQDKLQKLQNRAARVMTFSNYNKSASELFETLGWKNLACQQHMALVTMVFKCLHGLAPEYLCQKFTERQSVYLFRDSANKLNIPLPRTNYYKNSFSYSGSVAWNNLSSEARQAESLSKFKSLIS